MGLLDKIENKLGGSDKHEEQRLEQQQQGTTSTTHGTHSTHGRTSNDTYNTTTGERLSERQHPISSATGSGSGIVGGTAVTGGAGSEALTGSHGYGREGNVSSTTDQLRDTHLGGNTNPDFPRQPFDPYSSKGQQIAANAGSGNTYGASQGRAQAGDIGSRRDIDDPEVRRTHGGGISNGKDLKTGPHHHLENRDAVPTAGGHKVGAGATSNLPGSFDTYDNSPTTTHGSHHTGRDAALAGGAGAAGYGAYEATHGRDNTGPAPNTAGPHKSDLLNKADPRVNANPSRDTYDRDTGIGSDKYHAQTSSTTHPGSTTTSHGPSGIDRRTYDTTSNTTGGTYGQDVSYGNRPSADTPLTQSKDFTERHPHSTTAGALGAGAGAGALGGSALSHRQGDVHDTRNTTGGTLPGQHSTTTGLGSSQPGSVGAVSHGTLSSSDDHALRGSELAKRMGGAYESGYRDGYRDALAHKGPQV
ncbi:hypothetical protein PRZ48_012510 [Zasmidium cellare]|uniref:Dehydrin n=1 Tax=Zasmidium cellare TaxID=395010 RepID=A0ABR0E588_ZASCE|nr:hypothetical protein PRZ48_012510 [Zasmidium cellare]